MFTRKVTKKWTMKDGTKIRICDMTDSHLINTIMMLDRMHNQEVWGAFSFAGICHGDMASFLADQEADWLATTEPGDLFPIYEHLREEAYRRNLDVYSSGKTQRETATSPQMPVLSQSQGKIR